MAKYLKLFETSAEYQQFIGGGDFLRPNVSLVTDTNSLYYNPLEKELPYLTITALEDDLTVSLSLNPCQYSLNGTDWNELQADEQTPAINTGDKIYFKGQLLPDTKYGIGTFTISKKCNLSGNCLSLLPPVKDEVTGSISHYDYAFVSLFRDCKTIIDASQLKLFTAGYNVATVGNCYLMFCGCTSLVNAPELPATTLAESCYSAMFCGCTSLVNAPELPATTLAKNCYNQMFDYCTSLVNAPELPATSLTEGCYSYMFRDCTSLVNAPALPATTLAEWCYSYMFNGCTSLNYIKMLATDISADGCLGYWVSKVSPTGTFIKSKDATWNVTGKDGIPEGWTVETA